MKSIVLNARGVSKSYPALAAGGEPQEVLRNIDVDVFPGEVLAIVGPSGSGKSTLMHVLAGLDDASSGSVSIGGTALPGLSRSALARLRRDELGFIFQSYNLIEALNARDNAELPAILAGRKSDKARVDEVLSNLGMLEHASKKPSELSGGQQQRIAVARVMIAQPNIVFADEPTGALDSVNGKMVLQMLREYAGTGRSVVFVTHDIENAAQSDRVLVMRDGRISHEITEPNSAAILSALAESGSTV